MVAVHQSWGHPAQPTPIRDRGPFGHALKLTRERHRISQSRLADMSGIHHSYMSRLESGHRVPTRDVVRRIADALQLTDADRDRLMVAAGFSPRDPAALLPSEPEVVAVIALLASPTLPPAVAMAVRDQMAGIVRLATSILGEGS